MFANSSAQISETGVRSSSSAVGGALYMAAFASAHISEGDLAGGSALYFGGAAALHDESSLV
jgi:hypothetical protein